jgi:putative ABC transport system substrate-binding protein
VGKVDLMHRRAFVGSLVGGFASAPRPSPAQRQAIPTFGILLAFSSDAGRTFTKPLRAYLEALGYVEGRNILFDVRYAGGDIGRLPALAAELVVQRPHVIATFGDAAALAAKSATSDIPIVAMSEDLVRAKIVSSMSRPGRNITGLSILGTELDAKRLELLAEVLPARSAVLLLADTTTHRESRQALDATARALGVTLHEAVVGSMDEIEQALRGAPRKGIVGVNVLSSAFLFAQRARIIGVAGEAGLATISQWPETAEEGGLMAYGPSLLGAFRHVATLVAKILQGAKPADLPVEQPTRFTLYVNLNTAKALGIVFPQTTLLRADRVIE